MPLINNIKGYGKALAISLACYSLFSFFPSYAADTVKNEQHKPQSALELKIDYEKKLGTFTGDFRLNSLEIESLHKKLTAYLEAKDKESQIKKNKLVPVKPKIEENSVDTLASITEEFEYKILLNYPHIFSDKTTIKYDAFKKIDESDTLKELIERAIKVNDGYMNPNLVNHDIYQIKHLFMFHDFLEFHKEETKEIEKKPIKDSIFASKLDLTDSQFREINNIYKVYLDARDKEFARSSKYWSPGVMGLDDDSIIGLGENFFTDEIKYDVKNALSLQSHRNVDALGFYKNVPFKGKFPKIPNALMLIFGLGFPFLRTGLTVKYLKRDYDAGDLIGNILNSLLCGLVFDAFHPLIYPVRLFAIPFICEPARKIFKRSLCCFS